MSIEIDHLEIKIQADAKNASEGIDKLTAALQGLKNMTKGGAGLTAVANQLSKLNTALSGISIKGVSTLNHLGKGLKNLYGLENVKISSSIGNQITSIANAANKLDASFQAKMTALADGLRPLSTLGKANLTTFITQLGKLPAVMKELEKANMGTFAAQMKKVAAAMAPLASEMQKVSNGFSAFPIRIQRLIAENDRLLQSNRRTGQSFDIFGKGIFGAIRKITTLVYAIRRVVGWLGSWVTESSNYIENLNLFTITMGDATEEALEFANAAQKALGVDPSKFIRNWGLFQNTLTGFGLATDKAEIMSKNLTQIAYDMASFFDSSVETAMTKLQSAMSGQVRPLREWGYAIDQATLQQVAYAHGINQSVAKMSQAQKAQLRYVTIMEHSKNVMGDMARTIMTPANAMRIFGEQVSQLKRALGNLLLPAIAIILPYIQAFVEVLTEGIQKLAVLAGFEIPKIDYSGLGGVSSGADDAEDALSGATQAAKELKSATLGIDELNILPEQTDSGGGSSAWGGDLGLDLPEYDFLGELTEKTDKIKEQIKEVLGYIEGIAAGFVAWKITKSVLGWFADLKNGKFKAIGDVASGVNKTALGLGLMVAGFTIEAVGAFDMGYNGPNVKNVIQTAIGAAFGIAGSLLVFGTGPLGWTIGILAALTIGITSFALGYNKAKLEEDMANRFGEIKLSDEEIRALAERTLGTDWYADVKLHIGLISSLEGMETEINKNLEALSKLDFKVLIGVGLTEDDIGTYKANIDSYIKNCNQYVTDRGYAITIGIKAALGDSELSASMIENSNAITTLISGDLSALGKELQEKVNTAFEDGLLTVDEQKAIKTITDQMNNIMSVISQSKIEAKLDMIDLQYGGAQLTPETYLKYQEDLNVVAAQMRTDAQTSVENTLAGLKANVGVLELKLSEDPENQEYKNLLSVAQADLQAFTDANPLEAKLTEIDLKLGESFRNTITSTFGEELKLIEEPISKSVQDMLAKTFKMNTPEENAILTTNTQDFIDEVTLQLAAGINSIDLTTEASQNIKTLLVAMEPQVADLEKLAYTYISAGKSVPASVADGISDIKELQAVTGNIDALQYLVGQKMSTDQTFLNMLATLEGAGKDIDSNVAAGILDNIELVTDEAGGMVVGIKDTINGTVIDLTDVMVQNLKDLGIDLSAGLLSGAETQMHGNEKSWRDWAVTPLKLFKKENEINSPSKKFAELGGYISDGLWDGIDGRKSSLFANIGNWASGILSKVKNTLGIHSPSKMFRDEIGMNIGLGVADGLAMSTGSVVSAANGLSDDVKHALAGVSVPIAATTNLVSDGIPEMGQFFMSGEMAHRMAVTFGMANADNSADQIVSGIRDCMSSANAEQNALIRRQNEILMELLEKDGQVHLDSRDITDRQNQVNRMYRR